MYILRIYYNDSMMIIVWFWNNSIRIILWNEYIYIYIFIMLKHIQNTQRRYID